MGKPIEIYFRGLLLSYLIIQTIPFFPYLDSFKTAMSFTAMWLMTKKWIESWIYWIIVDVIGIGLYYTKEVKFISLLYLIFLVMAIIRNLREASLCTKKCDYILGK